MGGAFSMHGMKHEYKILVRKPKWKRHLENLGIDGRIISEWI
jgi:hypothetical protein